MNMTYRDACKQAIRAAMLADKRVFLMGEDVARYGGCYAVTKGLSEELGEDRIRDTPLSEDGYVGAGIGAAIAGMRPIVEIMTVNFSLLGAGPDRQQCCDHPAYVGRPVCRAASDPHGDRCRSAARRTALAQSGRLVCAHSRSEGAGASDHRRRAIHVAAGIGRSEPCSDLRARHAVQQGGRTRSIHHWRGHNLGKNAQAGAGCHADHLWRFAVQDAGSGGDVAPGRHRGRGRRSARAPTIGHANAIGLSRRARGGW